MAKARNDGGEIAKFCNIPRCYHLNVMHKQNIIHCKYCPFYRKTETFPMLQMLEYFYFVCSIIVEQQTLGRLGSQTKRPAWKYTYKTSYLQ